MEKINWKKEVGDGYTLYVAHVDFGFTDERDRFMGMSLVICQRASDGDRIRGDVHSTRDGRRFGAMRKDHFYATIAEAMVDLEKRAQVSCRRQRRAHAAVR